MKFSLASVAALLPLASAHYFFDVLIIDGVETRSNEYVRSNTREAKYNPTKWENIRDDMTPDVDDFRCNKGAFTFAGQTGTAEVAAGSKIGFKLAVGATMQHPGPALVYMSKAPTTAQAYEGDGEWFKVFEESVCNTSGDFTTDAWCTWDRDTIEFTIPADLPDGEYLIRPEHIGVHGAHVGQAEFYYTCAQVKVTGGGNGVPGPTVKFPGAYKRDDPSFNFSIYGGVKDYPMPGPAVWTGGNSGGSETTPTVPDEEPTATPTPTPTPTPVPEEEEPVTTPTPVPGDDETTTPPPSNDDGTTTPPPADDDETVTPPPTNDDGTTCRISRHRRATRNSLRHVHKRKARKASKA